MTTYSYLQKGHSAFVLLTFLVLLGRAEGYFSVSFERHCNAGYYVSGSAKNYGQDYIDNYKCTESSSSHSYESNFNYVIDHNLQYNCLVACIDNQVNPPATYSYVLTDWDFNTQSYYKACRCVTGETCTAYGTFSYYKRLTSIEAICSPCPAGQYQGANQYAGSSCTTKSVTGCNAGFGFTNGGTTADNSCSACGQGFYQPNDGSTNVCTAHSLSSCPAGQYYTAGSATTDTTCTPCPDNEYSSGGTATECIAKTGPTTCPSGQGFTDGGAIADNSCAICPAGTAKLGNNADACEQCPVGTFSAANASQCTPWLTKSCPAGQQITDQGRKADASCEPCPTGTYKQGTNGDQCIACPAGSEVTPVDSSSGATGCQLCTRASHYDSTGSSVNGCETVYGCPKGHHMIITPPDQNNLCHACPAGTYQGVENSTATSCTDCFPYFFSLGGAESCTILKSECPAGFQISSIEEGIKTTHDRECEVCPEGTFKDSTSANSCTAHDATVSCPAGQEARGTTSTEATCQPCPSGHFKAAEGTEKCIAHRSPCDQITQTEITAPSATEDRVCANNLVHAETTACCAEWQDAEGICQLYTTECAPGFELNDDGGVTNDRTCSACPALYNEVTSGTPDQSVDATECANQGTMAGPGPFGNDFPAGCSKLSSGTYYYNTHTSTKECSVDKACIEKSFTFKAGTNADQCTPHRTTCPEATELNLNGDSTIDHSCDPCQAGEFKAGTNADQCATCGAGTWTPDNIQCIAHTVCDATTEIQLAAGTTSSDTVCGCAENHYSDGNGNCLPCDSGETRLAGDSKTTTTQCCSVAYQSAVGAVCTPYSEDAASCNALRKPFVNGDASTDASCGSACDSTTEYASGDSCVPYTTTCPAGEELSTTLTPAADKFCSKCPQGTYKEDDGPQACATCARGYEVIPLDSTEGATGCEICDKLVEYDADGSHTRCQVTEQHCDAGSYFTLTEKEHANTCTPCDEGQFQPLNATTNACQPWTVCLNTEIEVVSPTRKRDRVCGCKQDHKFSAPAHASVVQVDFGSSGGDHYVINGENDPTIKLCKDTNIKFKRTSSSHPLRIVTEAECAGRGCDAGSWTGNVAPAAIAGFTDIQGDSEATVNLPEGVYYYLCTLHRNMVGKIIVGSCDASCNACAAGTRVAGDSKLGPETTCCVNGYQKDGSHLCTPATDCLSTEVQQSALGRDFDRKCMCAENHHFALPAHASITELSFTSNGISHYILNGQDDPDIHLCNDQSIAFKRDDGGHALRIVTAADCAGKGCDAGAYTSLPTSSLPEFANGDISGYSQRVVTLSEGIYYYVCNAHSSMVGKIIVGSCEGSCQACGAGKTRLEGDDKEASATSCCTEAFQSAAKATCTPFITTCADNKELTGGTASSQKVCADCPITKISTNGDPCQTFAQKHYSANKPTTKSGIENAFTTAKSSFRSSSVKAHRLDFRSMIQLMKTEIASLTKRRIKLDKSEMSISTKFAASLGSRTDVEVVVPKAKTKITQADACTESDIDLNNQQEAYEVSLEEGETSLICATNTPRTKLRFEKDSNNHNDITEDVYKYSCWDGSAWGAEVQVTVGDDYQCGDNKYYVNSHSGVTCTTSPPVSSLDANVVVGTDNCGTVGEGHECTDYSCNANFILQTPPTCSADTYTPPVCHCPENFYEDGLGSCIAHSTEPELGCNAQRKPYVPGTDTTNAQCGAVCLNTQYASGENCISYTETAETCNAIRKTFLAGGNDFDATCPTLCLETQYAEGGSCHDLLVNCADGFEIGGGSNSTNRDCTACPEGEYKHGTNADSCQPCGEGYEIIPLGATTAATNCEVCEVSEYDHDNSALTGCLTTNTTCNKGHQILITSNLERNLCIPCETGKFQSDDNTTAQCTPHTVVDCGDGEELTTAPSAEVDGVCTLCGENKFKIGTNTNQCQDHSTCPIGSGLVTLGTRHTDTICEPCLGTTFSNTDDKTACVEHATCPIGSGLVAAGAGTDRTDTICGACVGTTFSGTDDKTACIEHATCPVGEGLLRAGNATHDTLCEPCPSGFYSSTNDKTACIQHATCDIGIGVKDFSTASTNTVCQPCVDGSTYSDANDITVCSTCTASCPTGYRVKTQCTVSQDLVCEPDDCPTMPDHTQVANAAGQGTCVGTLSPNQTCTLECAEWYYPAEYICQIGIMEPPATSCLASISECNKGEQLIVVDPISENYCQNCPAGTFQSLDNTREACQNFTKVAMDCNVLRKPFVAGDAQNDASCGNTCALTQYASGDSCIDYYTTAPAGSELILNGNEYTQHEQRLCGIGTYKALSDDSSCLVCEDGYEVFPINAQSGATGCQICDVRNEFDADLLAHTGCVETLEHCPAGFQHIETNSTSPNICSYCQDGTFQPKNNTLDQCQPYATTAVDCNTVRKKLESAGVSKIEDDSRCAESEVCDEDHYASGFDCLPYSNTEETCNAVRKTLIHGTGNDQDNSACSTELCSSLHYANGDTCTLYANTEASCNLEKKAFLTIGSSNDVDNSACAATTCAFEEHASGYECVPNQNTEASCLAGTTRAKATEFLVSNHPTSHQNKPALAALQNGNLVAVWMSDDQDTDQWGIFGRLYDNQGTALGNEFKINSHFLDEQSNPAVAALSDGGFVVVWRSENQDDEDWGIYQQRYDATGNALGGEVLVNSEQDNSQEDPHVAALDGSYVVVWESEKQHGPTKEVFLQRYDNAGTALGGEEVVNEHKAGFQIQANVAALAGGGFVVLWEGEGTAGTDDWGIFAKVYDKDGVVVKADFLVNDVTADYQEQVVALGLDEGGFVAAWKDDADKLIYGRAFDKTFSARGARFVIDSSSNRQEAVSLEAIPDGGFIAAWQEKTSSTHDIMAKRFTKALAAQDNAFIVNNHISNEQKMPSLALLSNNQLFVAWQSEAQDNTNYESIYARQYTIGEANSRVIYSTHNNSDNSECQVCLHQTEFADKDQCKCLEDHYFTGEACAVCTSGTRLAGDTKEDATQCCVGGYQSAIGAVCTAYSVDAASCNALRRPLIEGTASQDASCGNLCNLETQFAQGTQCVDYIDSCLVGFELTGGTNDTQKTCQACQAGHYKSINGSSACLPHTTCLATEIQTLAPSTKNDRICGCAENHYFNGTICIACEQGTRLAGDQKTTATQCCVEGFQSSVGEVCTPYTETTDSCNPQRKPLIEGTASEDSQCAPACNITEYAHLTECKPFATSCPAGQELFEVGAGQDKICVKCSIGTFKNTDDGSACQVCADGYEVVPIGAQEGGQNCIICDKAIEYDHDKLAHTGCVTTTNVCHKMFQLVITNETQSNLCENCEAEHYQDLDNTTEQCKPWTVCDINQTEVELVAPSLANNRVCGCELDHYFDGSDCQACAQGTRLAGDPKTTASECCVHGYQSAIAAECTPYTFNNTYCNGLRKTLPIGERNADNACGDTCDATEFAQATDCVPYITSCGNGTYLTQENTPDAQKQCLPCPAGFYKDFEGAGSCVACAAGSEVSENKDQCNPCPVENRFDDDQDSSTICVQSVAECNKGTELIITDAVTDNRCDACPANTFQDQDASTNKCQPFTKNETYCNALNRKLIPGNAQNDASCSIDLCLEGEEAVGQKCLCKENYRLLNGVCTPCAEGFFRDKGDDKLTTQNTTCEESGCSEFPALSSVLYAIGVGTCNGTLRHQHQCHYECAGGHQRMALTCNKGNLEIPETICSRCPKYQHTNEQHVCVDDTAYIECNCTSAACPESGSYFFSIGRYDRDDSECRQEATWVEQQLGQAVERPETPTAMVDVFENMAAVFNAPTITTQDEQGQTVTVQQNITKEEKREQFQSIVEYIKDEIEALPDRRIEIPKEVMVLSDSFLESLGERESVELVIPKQKTLAKLADPVSACDEKDVDLAAQVAAYDVSLASGDTSLLCRGQDPVTKLEKKTDGFEYSCFENGDWQTAQTIQHDQDYFCGDRKFYVNSHSGLTCNVIQPVSADNLRVVTGTNIDCGISLAEGETCQTQCNPNFVKVSEANCTKDGFQPATCRCDKDGFAETEFGTCEQCPIGSYSLQGAQCIPWSVSAETCNAQNKVFIIGNAQQDSACGQTCPNNLKAEWDTCTDPNKKIHCDTLSWMYFSGHCCDSFDNTPTCLHQIDRNAIDIMQSLSYIKREDKSDCQEGDNIVFKAGTVVCQHQ